MTGLSSALTVLVHACGILAVVNLYGDVYESREFLSVQCKDNETCWKRIVDFIPENLLQIEVGFVLKVSGVAIAVFYVTYLAIKLYGVLFSRLDSRYTERTRDIGYMVAPGKTRRDVANMVRKQRKIGELPPLYPNGWYEVMRSEELPVGTVKAVFMIGKHFAVFRRENGQVSVLDAYCPHLGANLGVGGHVRGNCIECPFHGWQFDGETGKCTKIPYAAKVPSVAKTKVWPSMECNQMIFVWYDAEGRDPSYELVQYDEIKKFKWTYRGRIVHYINAHIEEIPENGADLAHLPVLHKVGVVAGAKLDFTASRLANFLTHHWNVKWEALPPPQSHVARITLHLTNKIFGWVFKPLEVDVVADQIGPTVVGLKFKLLFGTGIWIQTVVPEEPLVQRMVNYVYADWWIPTFIVTSLLRGMGTQVERDVCVWSNKTYVSRPLLVKEDHLILAHRRWYSQFYSEHSPKLEFKKENDLDW